MPDISELQLRPDPLSKDVEAKGIAVDDSLGGSDRSKWIALVVLFAIAAGIVGYVVVQRSKPKATPAAPAAAPATTPAQARQGPLVEAENIPLPPLAETDALVRQLLVKLSSHPQVLAWLATNRLIANFTVATVNVSEGKSPTLHWPTLAPKSRFTVVNTTRGVLLDPRTYRRYDEYAAAIGGLDAAGTARLYLTLKPRILDAYRELGYPDGDFDPVLERSLHGLIAAPIVEKEIPLREKVLSYQFADADLESLTAAQKQLLRMGPANMRVVQAKLREIATQLGFHP